MTMTAKIMCTNIGLMETGALLDEPEEPEDLPLPIRRPANTQPTMHPDKRISNEERRMIALKVTPPSFLFKKDIGFGGFSVFRVEVDSLGFAADRAPEVPKPVPGKLEEPDAAAGSLV
jgi:hypothetical protein